MPISWPKLLTTKTLPFLNSNLSVLVDMSLAQRTLPAIGVREEKDGIIPSCGTPYCLFNLFRAIASSVMEIGEMKPKHRDDKQGRDIL